MSLYTNYSTLQTLDAKDNINATVNPQRFSSAGEQTIYIKIKNKTTNAFFTIRLYLSVTT
jgi:hypothetical protein